MDASTVLNRSRQAPAQETTAFGGIAERFRRAGDLDRAIALCREGLQKFPEHLSARVTLGWALLDKGLYDEAQGELEQVLKRAPDNLAAIRGLAELHERAENAVELSLDGPGPWPPDASTIESAAPAGAAETRQSHATPPPGPPPIAEEVRPAAKAQPVSDEPAAVVAAPAAAVATPPAPETPKAFANLIAEPSLDLMTPRQEVAAAPVASIPMPSAPELSDELGDPNTAALLSALDELEGTAPAIVPVRQPPAPAVIEAPVMLEPEEPIVELAPMAAVDVEIPAELVVGAAQFLPAESDVAEAAQAEAAYSAEPVEIASLHGEPAEVASVESASVEVTPVEVASIQDAPVESASVEVASVDAAPVDTAPVDAAPVEAAQVEAVEPAPVEAAEAVSAEVTGVTPPVEVEPAAEVEVHDGFALIAESESDSIAADRGEEPPVTEVAGLEAATDTDSLSLDFETIPVEAAVPEPVPAPGLEAVPEPAPVPEPEVAAEPVLAAVAAAAPSAPVRGQATVLVLERMLRRVQVRRTEVASEYHLAS